MSRAEGRAKTKPLAGKKILVTRSRSQATSMVELLAEAGAEPVELPVIEIVPNPYPDQTRAAIDALWLYDWVIFTSVNSVEVFLDLIRVRGEDEHALSNAQVGAIGRATGERLRSFGIEPDFVPDEFVAEAVLDGLRERGVAGKRILLPRAEVARDTLPTGLRESGAIVDVLPVYRTVSASPNADVLRRLDNGEIDVVTFTSSSTVHNLIAMLDRHVERLSNATIACIGPITADTARGYGLDVAIVAVEYSIPGLVDAIRSGLEEETE